MVLFTAFISLPNAFCGATRGEAQVLIRCRKQKRKNEKNHHHRMSKFYDIHTHRIHFQYDDNCTHILNINPFQLEETKTLRTFSFFSCGVHPWSIDDVDTQMARLKEIASDTQIVAIGETGFDKNRGAEYTQQLAVFYRHIELSEKLRKPLIIHCVRAWNELLHVKRAVKHTQPWIIHSYRGKPELTQQLVNEGFLFSIGSQFNPLSLSLIPIHSLFCETDESNLDIREIYSQAAITTNVEIEMFTKQLEQNVWRVFPDVK